jgi:hypothetical protein
MTGQLETPREGLMNIAASFPSVRNQGYQSSRKKPILQKVMLASFDSSGQFIRRLVRCFALPAATRNLHTTQPNTLFPTYDEVVNLTGLL